MRKLIIILAIFFITAGASRSQEDLAGGSPYSLFGIGDLNYFTSQRTYGMGITGVSLLGNYMNSLNPAAVTKINATTINLNFNYGFLKTSSSNAVNKLSSGNLLGINIGIPFDQGRGWVMTLGFNPYSDVDYNVQLNGNIGGQNYTQSYSGTGGLSRINLGMTYSILREINVGLEYNYSFGQIKNENLIDFTNASYNDTRISNQTDFQKSFLKGGVIIEVGKLLKILQLRSLTLGFVFQSGLNLNATKDGIYRSSIGVDTIRIKDGQIEIPDVLGFGITNNFGNKVIVSADVVFQDWSNYREYGVPREGFQQAYRGGLGVEFLPSVTNQSFWGKNAYRLGAFYENSYYKVNNESINTLGFRGGVNIPISRYNSLDFAVNYSFRGKTDNGLIKDEFLNFTAGVNFGEIWFIRPSDEDK
ncbi:MAG: hypothetical protein IPM38_02815 [Ignavibacteria bacterium]|nr:hypothetical protein [Ignavibacteria bacterium]